jgi:hypothetical protein
MRKALGPVQGPSAPPPPPRDSLPGRGRRKNSESYHIEDEFEDRWFEPKLSETPDLDHQIQAVRIAFEYMEDAYKDKTAARELGPGDAEFRLRGLLDTLRTLKWLKDNEPAIKGRIEGAKQ